MNGYEVQRRFREIMSQTETIIQYAVSNDCHQPIPETARYAVYDFTIKSLLRDLTAEVGMRLYLKKPLPDDVFFRIPFAEKGEDASISHRNAYIIAPVYDIKKFGGAILDLIQSGFELSKGAYHGTYYKELNLVVVDNGIHHTHVASIQNAGSSVVNVVSLAAMFPYVQTDGIEWNNTRTGEKLPCEMTDWRLPILFELARKKQECLLQPASEIEDKRNISYNLKQEELESLRFQCKYYKEQYFALYEKMKAENK